MNDRLAEFAFLAFYVIAALIVLGAFIARRGSQDSWQLAVFWSMCPFLNIAMALFILAINGLERARPRAERTT